MTPRSRPLRRCTHEESPESTGRSPQLSKRDIFPLSAPTPRFSGELDYPEEDERREQQESTAHEPSTDGDDGGGRDVDSRGVRRHPSPLSLVGQEVRVKSGLPTFRSMVTALNTNVTGRARQIERIYEVSSNRWTG